MPKTPDEIKKGLECCARGDCHSCPYVYNCILSTADALALIQQLQAESAKKDARIQQLEAERDAAVADLTDMGTSLSLGKACKWCDETQCESECCVSDRDIGFKWRGVPKEE